MKNLDENEDSHTDTPMKVESNDNNDVIECRMGLRNWRPDWLQHINTIQWFLVTLSISSLTQGIVIYGLVSVSTQSIEKEFGISSKISGSILACQHASTFIVVTYVSFFGGKGSKPKWMGIGSLITALGAIIFALPKLLIGSYHPAEYDDKIGLEICRTNKTSFIKTWQGDDETFSGPTILHGFMFVVGQLLMGAGTTPHYTLGPAYLDENLAPKSTPVYLGIWYMFAMMGPAFGFTVGGGFLKIYTDIHVPTHLTLTPSDPRWVGAWWLGFVTVTVCFIVSGIVMLLYPKQMKGRSLKREEAITKGHIPSSDNEVAYTFNGYLKECFRLCMNKIFMLMVFGTTVHGVYGAGLIGFVIKMLNVKFGVSSAKASMAVGMGLIIAMIGGIMGGSCIMKRVKVQVAAKSGAKICALISLLMVTSSFMWIIPGCRNTNLAGVIIPYHNSHQVNTLISECNSNCTCSEEEYLPLCGSDEITYYSPCFAGCMAIKNTPENGIVFGNCSCIPKMTSTGESNISDVHTKGSSTDNNSSLLDLYASNSLYNHATIQKCDRGCKNFYWFVFLVILLSVIGGLAGIPHKIVLMRCVPDNKRSFSLGMMTLIFRVFTLPAPVLIGTIVDTDCITWRYDIHGKKKHCLDYDINLLSQKLVLVGSCTAAIGTVLYTMGWWLYPVKEDSENIEHIENEDALQLMA